MSASSVTGPASNAWQQYMQKLRQTQLQVTMPQVSAPVPATPAIKPAGTNDNAAGAKDLDIVA
jgi:hypothetical protein